MKLVLLPEPKHLKNLFGSFVLPARGTISVSHPVLRPAAVQLNCRLSSFSLTTPAKGIGDTVRIDLKAGLKAEQYRLTIVAQGIGIEAGDVAGARHAVRTLTQILDQNAAGRIPCLAIDDQPDFAVRGVYYDVCRGRVPNLSDLMVQVERLADVKVNQLQYYIEHTYRFRQHPLIGEKADPLTADDLMCLDGHCLAHGIELVPSLASFGHMANILTLEPYRKMAEDYGVGKFKSTEGLHGWLRTLRGWTLSPANPKIYDFLDSLFAEFLPCFSSDQFNVCCDETFDLGLGQTFDLCAKKGKGRVYLDHLLRLHELCKKHGKRMQFWGDIVRHHPEFIKALPKDVTVLDWGYNHNHNFEAIRDFTQTGLTTYACPGTWSWGSLFPRMATAETNIAGFAAAGKKHGATGLLNTDWGDGGHYNFMEYSWPGYWFGAEQAWNTGADRKSFMARFCKLFLKSDAPALPAALRELGDIAEMGFWMDFFFAAPGDMPANGAKRRVCVGRQGKVIETEVRLNAAFTESIRRRLEKVRAVFVAYADKPGVDPDGVLPYWIFGTDTILFAARKMAELSNTDTVTAPTLRGLATDMKALQQRFETLWMARNRRSEIQTTLNRYQLVVKALQSAQPLSAPFITTWRVSKLMPSAQDISTLAAPATLKGLGLKTRKFGARFCDMHPEIEKAGKADHTLYYVGRLQCAEPMQLKLMLGYDGPVKLWVDGKARYCNPKGTNPAAPDMGKVSLAAAKGDHEVVVALGTNQGQAWGIFLQVERTDKPKSKVRPVMV